MRVLIFSATWVWNISHSKKNIAKYDHIYIYIYISSTRLLRLWVQIPPGAWMFVCCECCVLSGRSLCDELITRPEESYRLWCVVVCDLETSNMRRPWPALGRSATEKKNCYSSYSPVIPLRLPSDIPNPATALCKLISSASVLVISSFVNYIQKYLFSCL